MNWWDKNPERLEREKSLMNQKFPQFKIGQAHTNRETNGWIVAKKDQKYWLVNLRTKPEPSILNLLPQNFIKTG